MAEMSALVPTLRSLLDHADALFEAGRIPAARAAFEDLLERAQDKSDTATESMARTMLARCLLRRKDVDGARDALDEAARRLPTHHMEASRRYQAAVARVHVALAARAAENSGPEELTEARDRAVEGLRRYLDWARDRESWTEAIDACRLLGETARTDEDRASWLQMGVDVGVEHEIEALTGRVYNDLAVTFESLDRPEAALDAWEQAHHWYRRHGAVRQIVSAAWAAGALACRLEDWPLAQIRLEQAIAAAEPADDCGDLLALALADLSRVHEASGDTIEARRSMIRAVQLGREHDLMRAWPERWRALREQARRLELDGI